MAGKEKVFLTREQSEGLMTLESLASGYADRALIMFFDTLGRCDPDFAAVHSIEIDDLVFLLYNVKEEAVKNNE